MADNFGISERELPEGVSQESYSPWTSLAQVTLLVALEEHFGLTFSMAEMQVMNSLPSIVAVLKRHRVGARR